MPRSINYKVALCGGALIVAGIAVSVVPSGAVVPFATNCSGSDSTMIGTQAVELSARPCAAPRQTDLWLGDRTDRPGDAKLADIAAALRQGVLIGAVNDVLDLPSTSAGPRVVATPGPTTR